MIPRINVYFFLFGILLKYLYSDDRFYQLAFSHDGPPANFVKNGVLVGQSVDLVERICKEAGKDCRTALVHRDQCWNNVEGYPPFSAVLNGRWFDGCANLPWSSERAMSYAFPDTTFFRTDKVSLIVRTDSKIQLDDIIECNDFTLAYPANTALEPDCLHELGLFIQEDNYRPIILQGDLKEVMGGIIDMVRNKEVDMALVITRFQGPRLNGVKPLNANFDKIECLSELSSGLNVMMRADDTDFIKWWDKAVHKFICSDEYPEFCDQIQKKYNADPLCRIPGEDLDCRQFGGPGIKKPAPPRPPVPNPCVNIECQFKERLKHSSTFFEVKDDFGGGAEKALKGSGNTHKGKKKEPMNIIVTAVDGTEFRVDKLCVTVNNAKEIKFILRGGSKEAAELNIPVDIEKEWSTHCIREQGYRRSIRMEFQNVGKLVEKKESRIRIRDLEMDSCLD